MSYKNISSNELKKLIQNNENILLIDVRSEEEFEEVNIETSINIPLQDLLYNIDELQDHNDKDITACNLLAMEGFNKLYNLERGIIDYLK